MNDDPDGLYELTSAYNYSWYGSLGDQPYTETFPLGDEVYRGESFSFLYANNETLLFDKLRLVVDYEDGLRNLERVATIVESADMPTLELNDSDTSTSEYEIDVEDYSTEFTRLSIRLNSVDHDGVLWPSQWHICRNTMKKN